eukprot:gnl/TRDRNA2_/TRDRNA2_175524_c2_seq3.p1 gnl/TRDRNA2_/TRDRNA2_175524_c2~~gnl/TRDRNA2_/TRDRNA2_175524_c2_seq3.p1  ORF type:complete len:522 (+),score=91.36 gnl/TRDRNA2_/TRDRNA2_175524_c2_seq3:929-2494(+)
MASKRQHRRALAAATSGAAGKEADVHRSDASSDLGRLPADAAASLTDEQRAVCEAAVHGESLFFTGGAGTGKSFLLNRLLQALDPSVTAVTASTALAASHLGGTTLHKWAGIGRAEGNVVTLARELRSKRDALQRWRRTKTLVVDEISMVDGKLFAKLEVLVRAIRGNDDIFGGIQLVLSGDFLQLPPVTRDLGTDSFDSGDRESSMQTFCFEARCFPSCTFELTQVFRQQGDEALCSVLNEVRFGELSDQSLSILLPRLVAGCGLGNSSDCTTRLMPLRAEVERINKHELHRLSGELVSFEARDQGDPDDLDRLSGMRRVVELRAGALVVLNRTLDAKRRLVNGSQGIVIGFAGAGGLRRPVVQFRDANVQVVVAPQPVEVRCGTRITGVREQLPLELAWALSIHKSQGLSLSSAEVNVETVFEHGQAYVALSRVRTLDGLVLIGNKESLRRSIHAEPRCLEFHKQAAARAAEERTKAAGDGEAQGAPASFWARAIEADSGDAGNTRHTDATAPSGIGGA